MSPLRSLTPSRQGYTRTLFTLLVLLLLLFPLLSSAHTDDEDEHSHKSSKQESSFRKHGLARHHRKHEKLKAKKEKCASAAPAAAEEDDDEEWRAVDADPKVYTGATAKPLPNELPVDQMPTNFDWCNTPDGRSFCGPSWNQHIPQYCGSCYVHGALHAANDRIKLALDGRHDLMLARQVIINCGPSKGLGNGCGGGEVYDVFEYMYRYGLPDESCMNYMSAPVSSDPNRCEAIDVCMNCMPNIRNETQMECWAVEPPILYYAQEYGVVSGEQAIMNEIYRRGPVSCAIATIDDFDYLYRGGVYVDKSNATDSNHVVEVVGWGVDEATGLKYWRARNSWGSYWGENGFFRIVRGINNMRFEEECIFMIPDISDLQKVVKGERRGGMYGIVNERPADLTRVEKTKETEEEHIQHTEEEKQREWEIIQQQRKQEKEEEKKDKKDKQ